MERRQHHQLDQLHLARLADPDERPRDWRIAQPDGFDWRAWDDEFVVRVASSGATCLLSALAGHALTFLQEASRAVSFDDLAAALFGTDNEELTGDEAQALAEALSQLERLGLIEAASS